MDAHGCVADLSQALSHHPEETQLDPHSSQRQIRLKHNLQYPLNQARNMTAQSKTRAELAL